MNSIIRTTLIVFSLLLMVIPSSTQDSASYTLEPATIDEFIEAIRPIISRFTVEEATYILADEFWLRYADDASIAQISSVYEALNDGWRAFAFYSPYLHIERWHFYVLERWLTENPTDLGEVESFTFADYEVAVTELFVSDTEQPDWLLSLSYPTFAHHWLARLNPQMETGYQLLSLPTAFYEANYAWSLPEGGSPRIPMIEDITRDGLVEFIFTDWMPAPASWTSASWHSYEVISWNDEEGLHNILHTDILDDDPTPWSHENIDNDAALEIIQTVNYWDNLGCSRHSVTEFDYVDGIYVEGEEVSTLTDTIYCDLHQAESAYNNRDFPSAIVYYEQARERYGLMADTDERDLATPYFMYASEKLAISYALNGQIDQAEALIQEMNTTPQSEETIAYGLGQIVNDGTDAVEICQTAYSVMDAFVNQDWTANYRGIPQAGAVNEAFYGEHRPNGANSTVCELTFLLETIIAHEEFLVSTSPAMHIQDLGFTVNTTFSSDINDDGIDDWILWIDRLYYGYLFLSNNDSYIVNTTRLGELNQDRLFYEVQLPSGEVGIATFNNYQFQDCTEGSMNDLNATGMYDTTLWMLNQDSELVANHIGLVCAETESAETVTFDETITVWAIGPHDTDDAVTSSEMVWNPETLSYSHNVSGSSDDTSHRIPIGAIRGDIYFDHDYESAISRVNEWLDTSAGEDRLQLLYYRGLAYQMLGNDDAALADYVTVWTDAGWLIWGYLADLQLGEAASQ